MKKRQYNFIDLTNRKFGKLLVLEEVDKKISKGGQKKVAWSCLCDCGNKTIVDSQSLKDANTQSCGCYQWRFEKTHGMSKTNPHKTWRGINGRCYNKNNSEYREYGGRGIIVCEKWKTFEGFWEDMKDGYSDELSIDRIDNDGNYCKENCRWTTSSKQNQNKRIQKRKKSSKYKGVFLKNDYDRKKKYRSVIGFNKKQIFLGHFLTELEAAKAYDKSALELFGKNAYTNFEYKETI